MQTKVGIAGANGKLGRIISAVVEAHPNFELVAKLGRASTESDWGLAEIIVDVTNPEASPAIVSNAIARGQRVIIGTSGWNEENIATLRTWVNETPGASVIVVPNFSLGSVLGSALSRIAAPFFDAVEIIEAHHPNKIDSPSGTAVHTAEGIALARKGQSIDAPFFEQEARGELVAGIPVHSLRLAGVVAQQDVIFGGVGETLTITHDTHSSDAYHAGVRAALEASVDHRGVIVGLENILGINTLGPTE